MSYPFLEDQFAELKAVKNLAGFNVEDGYAILPMIHPKWQKAERRILFVVESMDSVDIRNGEMFTSDKSGSRRAAEQNLMVTTMPNVLRQSWKLYQELIGRNSMMPPSKPDFVVGFVNFNALKYFHLRDTRQGNAISACATRCRGIIEALNPTDVVCFGDTAATYLMPHKTPEILPWMRGRVYAAKGIDGVKRRWMSTLDIEPLYNPAQKTDEDGDAGEDASSPADLLYYVCRQLGYAFNKRHPYSLQDYDPKLSYVKDFDRAMAILDKWETLKKDAPIGLDLETASLEGYGNRIYTVQLAYDEDRGYMIPIEHPKTPFNEDQIKRLKARLKDLLSRHKPRDRRTLVGTNLQFDLKVLRAQLDIPFTYHYVWDIAAAEMELDENIALFNRLSFRCGTKSQKTTQGNLLALTSAYGCEWYWHAPFGKTDRMNFGRVDINKDRGAQEYGCMDSCIVLAIRKKQLLRASHIRLSPKLTYEDMFERRTIHIMGATCIAISHMHQHGSHVNLQMFDDLAGKNSPLVEVMRDAEARLRASVNVIEANAVMLKARGQRATNLMGQPMMMWGINDSTSLHTLMFDVLQLEPINVSKKTKIPSIDKAFLNEHGPIYPEVGDVKEWRMAQKLMGTYVKGWAERTRNRPDSARDSCLRPSFGFYIVTGRLNSFDPNLQQAPSRGKAAKYIKEAFQPRKGRAALAWDFNASEVRWACNLAKDKTLNEAFLIGDHLRRKLIACTDPEERAAIIKKIKTEGDIHVQSVYRFFRQWVSKDHPLRQAIKTVVFGVLYGKSVRSLMKDMQGEARYRHRDAVMAAEKKVVDLRAALRSA